MLSFFPCGEQHTISSSTSIEGRGFYHGGEVRMTFQPASAGAGITFAVGGVPIQAFVEKSITTPWHITAIGNHNEHCVHNVEHVLSAILGLGIDNITVVVEGVPFIPIFDGSALPYIELLVPLKCVIPGSKRRVAKVERQFTLIDDQSSSFALFRPLVGAEGGLKVTSVINFPKSPIGTQRVEVTVTPATYAETIGRARTFFHQPYTEIRWKKVQALFKILPERVEESPIIAWKEKEYITELRGDNEPVLHKVLDFMGDVVLCGFPISGDVFLYRPSHRFNREVAKHLARSFT